MADIRVALSEENDRLIDENTRLREALEYIKEISKPQTTTAVQAPTQAVLISIHSIARYGLHRVALAQKEERD